MAGRHSTDHVTEIVTPRCINEMDWAVRSFPGHPREVLGSIGVASTQKRPRGSSNNVRVEMLQLEIARRSIVSAPESERDFIAPSLTSVECIDARRVGSQGEAKVVNKDGDAEDEDLRWIQSAARR
jgi:hypothetical protein